MTRKLPIVVAAVSLAGLTVMLVTNHRWADLSEMWLMATFTFVYARWGG